MKTAAAIIPFVLMTPLVTFLLTLGSQTPALPPMQLPTIYPTATSHPSTPTQAIPPTHTPQPPTQTPTLPTLSPVWTLAVPYTPFVAAFSPDGKRLAVVGGYSLQSIQTYILDVDTRKTLLSVKGYGAAFSPDGQLFATGATTRPGMAYLWDTITGQQLVTMTGHTSGVWGYTFSPDGNFLATGSEDMTARVWDLSAWQAAGRPAGTLISREAKKVAGYNPVDIYLGGLDFGPDSKQLVYVCKSDSTAIVWDVTSGQKVLTLAGGTAPFFNAHFSPDGTRLATTGADGTVRLWDTATGQERLRLNPGGTEPNTLAFSPDGRYLATANGNLVNVWEVNTGLRLFDLSNPSPVRSLAFSPIGKTLVAVSTDSGMSNMLQAWEIP
jgi:WD40 repeat protein